jgi:hypothetical protein
MTILIDNHVKLQRLYDATAAETTQAHLKSQLLEFSNRISRKADHLRRARMQGVVEISLEPISDLDLNDLLERLIVIENTESDPLEKVIIFERNLAELCRKCSPRIEKMSADAGQLLIELSQECTERADQLSQTIESTSRIVRER